MPPSRPQAPIPIRPPLTTRERMMLSEFARALPHKVDELLSRCVAPSSGSRSAEEAVG